MCLVAVPGAEEEIASTPLDGAVRWTMRLHGDLASTNEDGWIGFSYLFGRSGPVTGLRFFWDRKITCVDELVPGKDGEPGERRRSFEQLAGEVSFTANSGGEFLHESKTLTSDLEGRTVSFRPSGSDEDPADPDAVPEIAFADGEPGEKWLLGDLWPDPEPLALLPKKSVQLGEYWRVDPEEFVHTLLPGGDARVREVDLGGIDELLLTFAVFSDLGRDAAFLGGDFEGTVWASWSGEVSREDERLAMIELEIIVDRSGALGSPLGRIAVPAWGWGDLVFGEKIDVDCRLHGKGLLYWNLERGRLDSLELRLRTRTSVDLGLSLEGYLDLDLSLEEVKE